MKVTDPMLSSFVRIRSYGQGSEQEFLALLINYIVRMR
jgi:hypothetical protein